MSEKRYFWLKLNEDFFEQKDIKKLRRMEGGDTLALIYLKMQLHSLKSGGEVIFEGFEDDIAEELALELDEDNEPVKKLIEFLEKYKLMEKTDSGFFIPAVTKKIGSEGASAERVRNFRDKKKNSAALQSNKQMLQRNNGVLQSSNQSLHRHGDIDKRREDKSREEKDTELEQDPDKEQDIQLEQNLEKDLEQRGGAPISSSNKKSLLGFEASTKPKKEEEIFARFPLKNGGLFALPEGMVRALEDSFPEVDVRTEILRAKTWLQANPDKQRRDGDMMRFITGWLFHEKGQKNQPVVVSNPAPNKPISAKFSDLTLEDLEDNSISTIFGGFYND